MRSESSLMAIESHSCEGEYEDWLIGDGQAAVEDYLRIAHEHNAALAMRDAGVPLPPGHFSGYLPVSTLTVLHALPLDVVSKVIWPLLMESRCHLENYRHCSILRCVSTGWKEYVERQREWTLGMVAHAQHRQQRLEQEAPDDFHRSTDSETDSEWQDNDAFDYWDDMAP